MAESVRGLNFVLLGKIGAGKSASGNTILGRQAFIAKQSSNSVTQDLAVESGTVDGLSVTVYDTPGLFNTTLSEEKTQQILEKVLQECESRPCVFLLVIKADRFTEEERKTVEKIEKLLGENRLDETWILFTGGDELEDDKTIKEFISETESLKKLVQRYDHRYHVFNNKTKEPSEQVQELLNKIHATYPDTIETAATKLKVSSRRIVLLGKSGVGKSAAGNTILGQKEFESLMRMTSVTCESSMKHTTVSGRSVSVVDTPGFFHTQMNPEELMTEIAKSVYISSPGPHAFLIVFRVDERFTEHELQIPQMIEMLFGQEVLKYSIILFTHGDQMEGWSVEEIIEENSSLRHLVDQCGDRFHVFNNKDQSNRKQVNDLLKKIDTMIEQNGGGHYSNQMYQNAHRFRREEEERRRREEKQKEEEIERVRKETEGRIREEYEGPPRLLQKRLKCLRQREQKIKKQEEIERIINKIEERVGVRCSSNFRRHISTRLEAERMTQQEKIGEVIKETEEIIRAEFKDSPRLISSVGEEREKQQQQEEKQRQEEFDRVISETCERIRAELEDPPIQPFMRTLMRCRELMGRLGFDEVERFKVEIQGEEEQRKQQEEKCRQKVIERVIMETMEAIRT